MRGLLALVFLGLIGYLACYAHTPLPPCENIENCGNPADVPPLTDRTADAGRTQ